MSVAHSKLFLRFLAHELVKARMAAGMQQEDAAERLHLQSTAPVSRFESAKSVPRGAYVEMLCDHYGCDETRKTSLLRLRELCVKPPWWSHLGPRPEATEGLLWLEAEAWQIRIYDLYTIPGLLQTEAMAEAINTAVDIGVSEQQQATGVDLRLERQDRVWNRANPPKTTCIMDESAFFRLPGSAEVRRSQLARLLDPPPTVSLHVLPLSAGPGPSMGAYNLFDIDLGSPQSTRAVHEDGSTTDRQTIVESEEQVRGFELAWERTYRAALSRDQSVAFLQNKMEEITDA